MSSAKAEFSNGPGGALRAAPALALALALGSCTPARHAPLAPPRTPTINAGADYVVDPNESAIRVYAYRGGPLAALGHNHALVVRGVAGRVSVPDDATGVSGQVEFAPDDFVVDDPDERAAGGADFPGAIPAADIDGTRRNLLGRDVLDVEHWPRIGVEFAGARGGPEDFTVHALVSVRGVESSVDAAVHVQRDADRLVADGEASLSQKSLGLTPFSVMLGALKVEDTLRVRYHLVARRR